MMYYLVSVMGCYLISVLLLSQVHASIIERLLRKSSDTTTSEHPFAVYRNGKVRLVDGPNDYSGRLEVFYDGAYGSVCSDFFDDDAARVVCRHLGYSGGDSWNGGFFGEGDGFYQLDDVRCRGDEWGISECQHEAWGTSNCGPGEEAGVVCDEPHPQDGELRLRDGADYKQGRVEVYHDGRWGTICDDMFDVGNAKIICRQLGFKGRTPKVDLEFGQGHGPIWLKNVDCGGWENYLTKCTRGRDWYPHREHTLPCHHDEDAGVVCR